MGKVTISTVLGYKEYVVENIKNIRGEDEENSDFRIYPDYHIRFIEDRRRSS